jgi:hypothetical protein
MTEDTNAKDTIFWIIFVLVVFFMAWYIIDLGNSIYEGQQNLIFTETIIEK